LAQHPADAAKVGKGEPLEKYVLGVPGWATLFDLPRRAMNAVLAAGRRHGGQGFVGHALADAVMPTAMASVENPCR